MLRRLCGSASVSVSTLAVLLSGGRAEATQLLIPAYFNPGPLWTEMTSAAAGGAKITAILNPNSGPGTAVDPATLAAVTTFEAAGGTVVGYVHTTDDKRAIADVEADVKSYESFYPMINGIFVDEMSSSTKATPINYYTSLYNYIKGQNSSYQVIGNPGDAVDAQYAAVADTLVTFEDAQTNTNLNYAASTPEAWTATASPSKTANIVYQVPDAATMLTDMAEAKSQNVGYVYFTDDGADGNPYDSLPTYFSAEVNALPEPASLAMVGAAGVFLRRRRNA